MMPSIKAIYDQIILNGEMNRKYKKYQNILIFLSEYILKIVDESYSKIVVKPDQNVLQNLQNLQRLQMYLFYQNAEFHKNQGFQSQSSIILQQLREQQKFLISSLQTALATNKMLLFDELTRNYYIKQVQEHCAYQQGFFLARNPNNQVNNYKQMMEDQENQTVRRRSGRIKSKTKIDTKNIPKNFGTAISIHIKNNLHKVKKLLRIKKISFTEFISFSRVAKTKINSLVDLRKLWSPNDQTGDNRLRQCYRIISHQFVNKHSLKYIFSSRIKNTYSHIRYRRKMLEGMRDPCNFNNLKDY